jgi:hypothetical protein
MPRIPPPLPEEDELEQDDRRAGDSDTPQEFWIYRAGSNWSGDRLGQVAGGLVSATLDQFLRNRKRI